MGSITSSRTNPRTAESQPSQALRAQETAKDQQAQAQREQKASDYGQYVDLVYGSCAAGDAKANEATEPPQVLALRTLAQLVFYLFDKRGDGSILASATTLVLRKLGVGLTRDEHKAILMGITISVDGRLTFAYLF